MEKNLFPIGFWNVNNATDPNVDCVKDWVDIGCTLTMTGHYDYSNDKEAMLEILDRAYENGIKLIFTDNRAAYNRLHSGTYEQDLKQLIDDFGNHPAVYGFFLGDEPTEDTMDDAIEAIKIFRRLCPDKEPFLNLLPYVPSLHDDGLLASSLENYKEYLVDFVKKTGINILSYDCYMQMCESDPGVLEDGALESYYKNLYYYSHAAKETGVQLWYTTLAVGHGNYRCPTQDDFRWEINTAVAHGVKSLFYWYLYADSYNFNYRLHPIDMLYERTDTFRYVSTENRIFQQVYGAVFTKLEWVKTYHANKAYGGYPLFDENSDDIIAAVNTNRDTTLIVSVFENKENPDYVYYALVNNDQRFSLRAVLDFKHPVDVFEVRNRGREIGMHCVGEQTTTLHRYFFAPGQMWVIAVKK